jgi:hypothetical protein
MTPSGGICRLSHTASLWSTVKSPQWQPAFPSLSHEKKGAQERHAYGGSGRGKSTFTLLLKRKENENTSNGPGWTLLSFPLIFHWSNALIAVRGTIATKIKYYQYSVQPGRHELVRKIQQRIRIVKFHFFLESVIFIIAVHFEIDTLTTNAVKS